MSLQLQGRSRTPHNTRPGARTWRRRSAPLPARICVVEDDHDIREALEDLLQGAGYEPTGYSRADEALDALEASEPDLILLDLMMPGMNGWQFRVEQKRRPKLRDIPVVALSADVSPYAAAIDADAYLSKPVNFDELQDVLEDVLLANERKRLAAKAMELERVRSLGMLTASVAHEINNPLAYLVGSLDMAVSQLRALYEARPELAQELGAVLPNLDAAVDGAERVSSIVKLLSTFSRIEEAGATPVDPVRAVQAAARLARQQIEARASFVQNLEPVPFVMGNEARLAQVVLNLLTNAAQAIPEGSNRPHRVAVSTRSEHDAVVIEVADDGVGMAAPLLAKIFDAFFTTKAPGTGTGLGLSISRDIVAGLGGSLSADSREGAGSRFEIRLPIAKQSEA
ncbi:MAG TPA: ATP-binding protein [Polyangiales bacterium]